MKGIKKMKIEIELEPHELSEELKLAIDFEETMQEICEWNKKTFPDATLGGQFEKLEEETGEFLKVLDKALEKEKDPDLEEFADVFIVLAGLRRFGSKVGTHLENSHLENMPFEVKKRLLQAIKKKMAINRKRKWKKSGQGVFRHK